MALALPFLWNHLVCSNEAFGKNRLISVVSNEVPAKPSTWCNAAPTWKAHFTGPLTV